MPRQKFYVVWKGRRTGVFDSWAMCEAQVKGFIGAMYKSFPIREQAEQAFASPPDQFFGAKAPPYHDQRLLNVDAKGPVWESLSVDAACKGNPGILEYRGVWTYNGTEVFHGGPYSLGTVNLGEFLGIVHGLAFLQNLGKKCPVYSDSRTAIKWVRDKQIKSKLESSDATRKLFEHIERALKWLHENPYPNQVIKWETAGWGEIPADFGRK